MIDRQAIFLTAIIETGARIVMRSGGDAGTAIHTSVPFGIAAGMASVLHCAEGIDRRPVESHRPGKKVAPGCLPGATSGEVFGRKHANSYREFRF